MSPRLPRRRRDAAGGSQLDRIEARLERLENVVRALAANDPANRRSLAAAREESGYGRAWDDPEPLISVTVATMGRPAELAERSLPSILGQTHRRIEVIVVGDDAGPETERVVASMGDDRLSFTELGPRPEWTDDPRKRWLVGATRPRNAAVRRARGDWIVQFDDDDAMRPDCLSTLLELARRERAEAVYGKVAIHGRVRTFEVGEYPPAEGRFSWAAGMYHAGLRFLERELVAAELDVPGDWWLAERMLRVGVRFAAAEDVLCDVHPSGRSRG